MSPGAIGQSLRDMRSLILPMDISLDGYVGAADGDVQWAVEDFGDPALQEFMLAGLWDAGTHLMGRGAYDDMAPTGRPRRTSTRRR